MTDFEYVVYCKQLEVLKQVAEEYSGRNIDNIIMQLESRIKEHEKGTKE